jgi:hypothetical protein
MNPEASEVVLYHRFIKKIILDGAIMLIAPKRFGSSCKLEPS